MLYFLLFMMCMLMHSARSMEILFHAKSPAHVRMMDGWGLTRSRSPGVFEGHPKFSQQARDAGIEVQVHRPGRTHDPFAGYHDNDMIHTSLVGLADRSGGKVMEIGKSSQQRPIYAVRLGPSKPGAPKVLYMGGIHGDEVIGPELVLFFGDHLLDNDYTSLMNHTEIYLLPRINPDGFRLMQRQNANGVDLNRNFPDRFLGEDANDIYPEKGSAPRQPETQVMMNWLDGLRPHLAVVMHGGSTVCNYPYDGNADGKTDPRLGNHKYTAAPDDSLYREVCLAYAKLNPEMQQNILFQNGITNGAAWYVLYGGLQDWLYLNAGTVSITTEVSNKKWEEGINVFARYAPSNLAAMTAFGWTSLQGLRGRVTDSRTGHAISGAIVSLESGLEGIDMHSDSSGYFVRMLPVGHHSIAVSAPGYRGQRIDVPIQKSDQFVRNFALVKE